MVVSSHLDFMYKMCNLTVTNLAVLQFENFDLHYVIVKNEENKLFGSWANVGPCIVEGYKRGKQLQQRDCKDGSNSICHKKEQTRFIPCKMSQTEVINRKCPEENQNC